MGDRQRTVSIIIEAKNQADKALQSLGLSLGGVAAAAGAATAAVAVIGTVISKAVAAAAEQERADIQLAAALRSVGQNTEATRKDLQQFIDQLEFLTTINDETISSVFSILIKFGGLTGEALKDAARAVLDFGAAEGNFVQVAEQLANVLVKGTGRIVGINTQFDVGTSKGQRFTKVLDQMKTAAEGDAEAFGQTFQGSLARLNIVIERMQEDLGQIILDATDADKAVSGFATVLEKARVKAGENKEMLQLITSALLLMSGSGGQAVLRFLDLGKALASTSPSATDLADTLGKGVPRAAGDAEAALSPLDAALKELGITTLREAEKEAAKLNEAFVLLTQAFQEDKLSGGQEQFDAISRALADAAAKLQELGVSIPGVFESATATAQEFLSTMEFIDKAIRGVPVSLSQLLPLIDEIEIGMKGALVDGALQVGDTLVDAAFGAKASWGELFKQILADIARTIARMLILRAITTLFGGPVSQPFLEVGGRVIMQRGGEVRGGIPGLDSVAALLTPGEIVLPASRAEDFEGIAWLGREVKNLRRDARAAIGGGPSAHILNRIDAGGRSRADIANLIELINEAVERGGFRLVSSEVL